MFGRVNFFLHIKLCKKAKVASHRLICIFWLKTALHLKNATYDVIGGKERLMMKLDKETNKIVGLFWGTTKC